MSNSKLLKEAIADAKAVRETAIANAKIALEEAFTPRLQSILSQKLQQEMEDEEEADVNEEYSDGSEAPTEDSSDLGDGDNKQPADDANGSSELAQSNPDTDVETAEVGMESDEVEKAEVSEGEEDEMEESYHEEEEMEESYNEEDEDELDLEAIIRELEEELDDDEEEEVEDIANDVVDGHEEDMHDEEPEAEEMAEEEGEDMGMDSDDEEIDLEEILREMGYGEEEEEEVNEEEEEDKVEEMEKELEEAYKVIKSLKSTINEVNLLNAKLLYTNKLFRSYDLTNEQKHKVVETLDRTGNVREVKLVFATLAESLKISGTSKKVKQTAKLTESFASKPVASTAPKKEIIAESNSLAERFKQLANIN
jgi:hypothetical protein